MRDELRRQLKDAMKAGDRVAVSALRSALGAIDNAEAVEGPAVQPSGHSAVAGSAVGLGAADVPRRELTEAELAAILQNELDERLAAAAAYEQHGQHEPAERLRAEAAALARCLP